MNSHFIHNKKKNTNTWKISVMCDTRVAKSWPWPTFYMKCTKGTKVQIDGTDLLDRKSSSLPCTWSQLQR